MPSRDFPLAPTPNPTDNTRVASNYSPKKIIENDVKPKYKYVEADVNAIRGGVKYSKKDSSMYERGFKRGREGDKFPYPSAGSSSYNAGNLEGSENKKGKTKFTKRN